MSIVVVYNPGSGKTNSLDAIKTAFAQHGVEPTYMPIADVDRKLPAVIAQPNITVVAAGGDGTINSVTRHIIGSPAKLAIIPAGTLNHFAREIGLPLDITKAVTVAVGMRTRQVDIGTVNEHVFLNNSSIGWYPRSLRTREELGDKIGKWPAAIIGSAKAAIQPRRYSVELIVDGTQHTYRTPFVFIGNNAYRRGELGVGQRETLQGGQLAIYVVKAQSFIGIARMLALGLFTKARRTQDFTIHHASECVIHTRHHRRLNVACDGEVTSLDTPLHYTSQAGALTVLVP